MTKKTRTAMKHGLIVSCILASFAMTSQMVAQVAGCGAAADYVAGIALGQTPDTGPNTVYRAHGNVTTPLLIHSVEQEYTEAARNAKISGNVLVNLIVEPNGNPSHIRVVRGLGMGLDEKAIQAVQQYKFKPGMKDGKPVRVELNISLNFNETAN
jgi:periplasmic protein TonB